MSIYLSESTPEQHLAILRQYEPEFIVHVEKARCERAPVALVLDGFRNSKEIVWACLWYAMEQGVMVTVVPKIVMAPRLPIDISEEGR